MGRQAVGSIVYVTVLDKSTKHYFRESSATSATTSCRIVAGLNKALSHSKPTLCANTFCCHTSCCAIGAVCATLFSIAISACIAACFSCDCCNSRCVCCSSVSTAHLRSCRTVPDQQVACVHPFRRQQDCAYLLTHSEAFLSHFSGLQSALCTSCFYVSGCRGESRWQVT